MQVPILSRRREAKKAIEQENLVTLVEGAIDKAIQPAIAMAASAHSGATNLFNSSNPFAQSGGLAGAFAPLPRDEDTFNSGFGPGFPLVPSPIDAPGPGGRTMPRRSAYLVSTNLQLQDRDTPWTFLKWLASECDIIQHSIQLIQDALVGLDWSWGYSPQILNQIMIDTGETNSAKAMGIARDKYGDELKRVSEFWEYPDKRMGFTFSQFLSEMIYNNLVYDGIAIYPQYNLGGELLSLSGIDPTTIKILRDNQGFPPRPPAPAYQQILYGFPRGEYMAESEADGEYQHDQLAYYIRRPRAESVYGYPVVEECATIATTYLQRQAWMRAEYTSGVTPRIFMKTAETETWTPEQLAFYENIMNDRLTGQINRRQMMFLLRPGMEPEQMKSIEETYKRDYDEWLVMQIGAKFGVPQGMLGIQQRSSIGGNAHKGQSDQSETFATDAMKNFLIDCMNDMARRFQGIGPELTMTCTGDGDDADDGTRATADASDVGAGIRTRNEIRAERGIPIMDEPEADQLGITTGTGVSFLTGTLEAQKSGMAMAALGASVAAANGQVPGQASPGGPSGANADDGRKPGAKPTGSGKASDTGDSGSDKPTGSGGSKDANSKDESPASKELATFAKFVRSRASRGVWRDFAFADVDARTGSLLNETASDGDFELVKEILDALKGREDTPKDVQSTERLMTYWAEGEGAAKIKWGVAGDFDRCRAELGKHVEPGMVSGLCANLHHRATGAWPGHAATEQTGEHHHKSEDTEWISEAVKERITDDLSKLRETYGILNDIRV